MLQTKEFSRAVGNVNVFRLDIDSPEIGMCIGGIIFWGKCTGKKLPYSF